MVVPGRPRDIARISREDLRRRIAGGDAYVLDVRTDESWASSHVRVPGAHRVRPDQEELEKSLSVLPRGKMIVTYCT